MNRRWFISGIIIFTIAAFVFMAGYQGIQDITLKLTIFSPEKYQLCKMMESIGGIAAVIGILIALAGIVEKNK
jgi:hypothetical protein